MNWSVEALTLPAVPRAVRVHQEPARTVLDRLVAARIAEHRETGRASGRAELQPLLEALTARFAGELQELEDQLLRSALEIGLTVAETILHRELRDGRYELEPVIRECLALGTEGRGAAQVHLHPADAERLAEIKLRSGTELVPDPALRRGEVQVASALGLVVREPLAALARVREALEGELER
jgi:flagellar biosynthesis/type III secretory pathway protein FliH